MHAQDAPFLLPVYSETRASRFLEIGWELVAVNHHESSQIPEFILGWKQALPAPSPDGGMFDIEDGRCRFKNNIRVMA